MKVCVRTYQAFLYKCAFLQITCLLYLVYPTLPLQLLYGAFIDILEKSHLKVKLDGSHMFHGNSEVNYYFNFEGTAVGAL